MKPFAAPLDDILFILNHVAEADQVDGYDSDLTGEIAGTLTFSRFFNGCLPEVSEAVGAKLNEQDATKLQQQLRLKSELA